MDDANPTIDAQGEQMYSQQQPCFTGCMTHEDMIRQKMAVCASYDPVQILGQSRSEQLCHGLVVVILPQKQKERQQSGAHRRSLPDAPNTRALSQRRTGSPCTKVSSQRTNKTHYTTVDMPKSSQMATFFNEEVIYDNNSI